MTPLALEIYKQLRQHLRSDAPSTSMTYGELASRVSARHPTHPRSRAFHQALTELSTACRANDLPCLPAIVWHSQLGRPSDGYYAVAHPRMRTEKSRVEAWQREYDAVLAARDAYPATLRAATVMAAR